MDEMYTTRIRELVDRLSVTIRAVRQNGNVIDDDMLRAIKADLLEVRGLGSAVRDVTAARYGIGQDELVELVGLFARASCIAAGTFLKGNNLETFARITGNSKTAEFMLLCASVSMLVGMGIVDEMVFGPAEKKEGEK